MLLLALAAVLASTLALRMPPPIPTTIGLFPAHFLPFWVFLRRMVPLRLRGV